MQIAPVGKQIIINYLWKIYKISSEYLFFPPEGKIDNWFLSGFFSFPSQGLRRMELAATYIHLSLSTEYWSSQRNSHDG